LFASRMILLFFISVHHFYSYQHHSVYCHKLQIKLLVHSYACKLFFDSYIRGEPRIFESRPHQEASRQTQLKVFKLSTSLHVILNGEAVKLLKTYANRPS
jgi:hypothetical protein